MAEDVNSPEPINLESLMHNQLLKYAEELSSTYKNLRKEHKLLVDSYYQTVLMGFDIITMYDEFVGGHCKRVSHYAHNLAQTLGMDNNSITTVKLAALLHDIGAIGIPKNILVKLKSGIESSEENLAIYRQHPVLNIRPITTNPVFKNIARIIGAHHENIDGSGFPKGLSGNEIPVESKVIAIVNTYDNIKHLSATAMDSQRITEIMEEDIGSKYDIKIFRAFKDQILGADPYKSIAAMELDELKSGDILAKNIQTQNGTIILSAETVLSDDDVERIRRFDEHTKLKQPIKIYKRSA